MFQQIQLQTLELVKLLDSLVLKQEGQILKQISADFIEDYIDNKVYFLQIHSYILESISKPNHVQSTLF